MDVTATMVRRMGDAFNFEELEDALVFKAVFEAGGRWNKIFNRSVSRPRTGWGSISSELRNNDRVDGSQA